MMKYFTDALAKSGFLKSDLDYHLIRASMVIVFLFFGYQKWFEYEAQVLIPHISNGPLISWMHPVFGIRGASWFLGIMEWLFCALLFLGFWNKQAGIVGAPTFAVEGKCFADVHLLIEEVAAAITPATMGMDFEIGIRLRADAVPLEQFMSQFTNGVAQQVFEDSPLPATTNQVRFAAKRKPDIEKYGSHEGIAAPAPVCSSAALDARSKFNSSRRVDKACTISGFQPPAAMVFSTT